jgi:hypothetical protein
MIRKLLTAILILCSNLSLDVGQRKPGIYLLKLTNDKVYATMRFIVD